MIIDYVAQFIDNFIPTGKGDEYHGNCPICNEHRQRMYVNIYNHKVICHNCGFSGSVITLISQLQGVTYKKAFEIYKNEHGFIALPENVMDEISDKLKLVDYEQYIVKSAISLPSGYKQLIDTDTSRVANLARKHLHSRLVTDRMIKVHKFGYCKSGKYANRAILPIWEKNKLRFWVARAVSKNASRKELSPSDDDYQISKSEVVFNIDRAARLYNAAVLSEGIYDAVAFGDIGSALLGKRLSEEQCQIILSYKDQLTHGVYLALDEDAKKNCLEVCSELYKYMPVYFVDIVDDPNAMGTKACVEALKNAEEYSPLMKIRRIFC